MNDAHRFIAGVAMDSASDQSLKIPANFWGEVFRRHHPSILVSITLDDYIATLQQEGPSLKRWSEVIEPNLRRFPPPPPTVRKPPTGLETAGSGTDPIKHIRRLLETALTDASIPGEIPARLDVWLEVARLHAGKGEDETIPPTQVLAILDANRPALASWPRSLTPYAVSMMDLVEDAVAELRNARPRPANRTDAVSFVAARLGYTNYPSFELILRKIGGQQRYTLRVSAVNVALDEFKIKGKMDSGNAEAEKLSDDDCAALTDAIQNADTRLQESGVRNRTRLLELTSIELGFESTRQVSNRIEAMRRAGRNMDEIDEVLHRYPGSRGKKPAKGQ